MLIFWWRTLLEHLSIDGMERLKEGMLRLEVAEAHELAAVRRELTGCNTGTWLVSMSSPVMQKIIDDEEEVPEESQNFKEILLTRGSYTAMELKYKYTLRVRAFNEALEWVVEEHIGEAATKMRELVLGIWKVFL